MNIVLIGMMGSGKTLVAEALAKKLQRPVRSTDALVEQQAGVKIADIVAAQGWSHFRALEHAVVLGLENEQDVIIDCGGGVVLDPSHLKILRKNGMIFYLHAPPEILNARLQKKNDRPLIDVPDPLAAITRIYQERLPLYNQADFKIDASDPSIDVPVAQILSKV
jgi:shikimate kinase